jgi:hypothetical protein
VAINGIKRLVAAPRQSARRLKAHF